MIGGCVFLSKLLILLSLTLVFLGCCETVIAINGVFVQGYDMYKVDFVKLKENNITEIYLYSGAVMSYGDQKVSDWINEAHKNGLKVNMVVPIFQENGRWHNPTNQAHVNKKLGEIDRYIKLGVDGINLDYIRYRGDAYKYKNADSHITSFVKKVNDKTKPKGLKLSLCIMPEPDNGIRYYGQNIKELSKNSDELSVMIYKGNYKKNSKWILETTKWYVENSHCTVKPILQAYRSDNNLNLLSDHELSQDTWSCINAGAKEVSYFQLSFMNMFPLNKYVTSNDTVPVNEEIQDPVNEFDNWLNQLSDDIDDISESIDDGLKF